MIFLCFLFILSAFLLYLSLLYLVDVSQMAILFWLFMGVVTFSCCIVLYLITRLVSGVGF